MCIAGADAVCAEKGTLRGKERNISNACILSGAMERVIVIIIIIISSSSSEVAAAAISLPRSRLAKRRYEDDNGGDLGRGITKRVASAQRRQRSVFTNTTM